MRIWRPRSLRGRVLGATLVLAAAGLLAANAATYGFLRSFLVGRVDQQLRVAVFPVSRLLEEGVDGGPGFGPGPAPGPGVFPSLRTYGALIDASGRVVVEASFGYEAASGPVPELPSGLPGSAEDPESGNRYLTVSASDGSDGFRVLAVALESDQGTLVVGIPLTETNRTLGRLLAVEGLVTVGVLVLLGAAALWLVRVGLRPLEHGAVVDCDGLTVQRAESGLPLPLEPDPVCHLCLRRSWARPSIANPVPAAVGAERLVHPHPPCRARCRRVLPEGLPRHALQRSVAGR
jgi:two-component system, OmpR family, sensor kinase